MPAILLTTLNARYPHSAFGLRYLYANLGPLQDRAAIREFETKERPLDIAEAILRESPRIVGIGVYIWNVRAVTELVDQLRRIAPKLVIVLGGPEVSFANDLPPVAGQADYLITGEADRAFADLCRRVLEGEPPAERIQAAPLPALADLALPYPFYNDEDIARRVIYVEASRGCPFACEFCLSSLDLPVRQFPLEPFLAALQDLLDRGARQFKFVDRTFNLDVKNGRAILEFFRERYQAGLFLHFEMIPDRLPTALRESIRGFPPGALQFEIGVQTFNDQAARLISRRQDNQRLEENLRWLRAETGVHVHADLIVGLPGEDLASFGAGFDRLLVLRPHEIQVGMLKRLRGTPITRHDDNWQMVYGSEPPYEILQTRLLDFLTMQRLRRFARYWDLVANSGRFPQLADTWNFERFLAFSDWLHGRIGKTHEIALPRLARLLGEFLGYRVEPHGRGRQTRQERFISASPDAANAASPASLPPRTAAPVPGPG